MEELVEMNALYGAETDRSKEISQVERLFNEFEAHERKEENSVEHYKKALGEIRDPVNRFLLQMIISDEEKHRAVTHAIVSTLKGSLTWTKPDGIFETSADTPGKDQQLLGVTEEFIDLERAGVREYKLLLKESEGYYHGLFKILLESMIRDSEKHIELLEYLRQRLKQE